MGFFDHEHYWTPKTAVNTIVEPGTKSATGALILEGCRCGSVRQIEYTPGVAPVIRPAQTPTPN